MKHNNSDLFKHRKSLLHNHLNIYISKKHITVMKPIMITIRQRIKTNNQISEKQFGTLIEYLKNDFKTFTTQQLWDFFSPLIYQYQTIDEDKYLSKYHPIEYQQMIEQNEPSTLENFMN